MPPQTERTKFTYEDFLLFPDDGKRHELIDGDHYLTPSPSTRHQKVLQNLFFFLQDHLRRSGSGQAFVAPMDVVLSETDVVEPDLLYVSAERASLVTEKNIRGAPDLVVEVVSESTRRTDAVVKRKLYERSGAREYWLVDPELETIAVYRLSGGSYLRSAELAKEGDDSLTSPLFPGFSLPLSSVFP